MLAAFLDDIREGDLIAPKRLAARLHLPLTRLSQLAHVNRNALTAKPHSPAVQTKLGEIARIVQRVADMTGDEGRAVVWFRHQPLPGFSGKTAEALVAEGHSDAVTWYIEELENGGYA